MKKATKSLETLLQEVIQQRAEEAVRALTQRLPVTYEVPQRDGTTATVRLAHTQFPLLVTLLNQRQHVYLHGPHGSGKSAAVRQAAQALGLPYYYVSLTPQTPESRVVGYLDAHGTYRPGALYHAFTTGGVLCIDEMDNMSPALQTALNGALENGTMAFPGADSVARHSDFILVGTGNTAGHGSNPAYPERRPFDAAFGDRFFYVHWDYDHRLETELAQQEHPVGAAVAAYVQAVREWARDNAPRHVPSIRTTLRLCRALRAGIDPVVALDISYFRGVDADYRQKVLANFPWPTEAIALSQQELYRTAEGGTEDATN